MGEDIKASGAAMNAADEIREIWRTTGKCPTFKNLAEIIERNTRPAGILGTTDGKIFVGPDVYPLSVTINFDDKLERGDLELRNGEYGPRYRFKVTP